MHKWALVKGESSIVSLEVGRLTIKQDQSSSLEVAQHRVEERQTGIKKQLKEAQLLPQIYVLEMRAYYIENCVFAEV